MNKKATKTLLLIVCFLVLVLSSSLLFLWNLKNKTNDLDTDIQVLDELSDTENSEEDSIDPDNEVDVYELTDLTETVDNSVTEDNDSFDSSSASISSDEDELPDVSIE